jgi:hypothetical protein
VELLFKIVAVIDDDEEDVDVCEDDEDDEEEDDDELDELDELLLEELELELVVLTVEVALRVARYAPPARMMIITTTTTISIARDTPDLYIVMGFNLIFLRLEGCYLKIANDHSLESTMTGPEISSKLRFS